MGWVYLVTVIFVHAYTYKHMHTQNAIIFDSHELLLKLIQAAFTLMFQDIEN